MLRIYAGADEEHPYVARTALGIPLVAIVALPPAPQPFPGEGSAPDPRLIPSPAEGHLPVLPLFRAFGIEIVARNERSSRGRSPWLRNQPCVCLRSRHCLGGLRRNGLDERRQQTAAAAASTGSPLASFARRSGYRGRL